MNVTCFYLHFHSSKYLLEARVFLVAIIISLIHHRRYIILETDRVVRLYTERRILDTVLHVSLHINLIRDLYGKKRYLTRGRHFHRQIVFKFNPYPTAFPYGNGMVLHFYQQQESSTTKTVHKVINKRLKTYV